LLAFSDLIVILTPQVAIAVLGCVLATTLCCVLGLALIRSHAINRVVQAAHAAAGQGSLIVDGRGLVIELNSPARSLLWPNLPKDEVPVLIDPIIALLNDRSEQHHLLKFSSNRSIELAISSSISTNRFRAVRGIAVRDVTEQRQGQRRLMRLAHYDSLTGLGNRRLFIERLEVAIGSARDEGGQVALLYIDLDRFKEVNDTLGHAAGDTLLKTVSARIEGVLVSARNTEHERVPSVSRLSGDEFAIVLPRVQSMSEIEELCQRVRAKIAEPIQIADRPISSSGSIGVAIFPDHAESVEDLVKHADSALYVAKSKGRARQVIYEASFSSQADRAHQVAQELHHAIERNEFSVHYQPKVNLEDDRVCGFEALLRWYNRELDFVGPKEFIPVAEERGLINEIGAWCLDQTCRQIRIWQDAGFATVPVSVNVSSAQFRDTDVQRVVSDALVAHDVHPSLLEIELTESLLLDDDNRTALALRDLRAIGVRVALDDFGTGYSALTYLNRFPLDVVKMDRGFIRDIEASDAAAGIAAAVVSMSHSLGFEVVAEGVDSPPQADLLRKMGCDQIQGFLFSPALPSEEVTQFLGSQDRMPPKVKPILAPIASIASIGEDEPPEVEDASLPAVHDSCRVNVIPASTPPRILVIDSIPSSLGTTSYRLTQLEADVHLVTGIHEARLFVRHEEPTIDLVIACPDEDLGSLGVVNEMLAKIAPDHTPRLLICGAEPDKSRRKAIREARADWVLWEPFDDPELRFFVNAARSNRSWKYQRQSVRVPFDSIAWIRSGGSRSTGVVTSLSRRGAFIETSDNHSVGQPIRLEFKVDAETVSLFANVSGVQKTEQADKSLSSFGINVIFYQVDSLTDAVLADAVERLWLRFRA
jgi:diguanylate cyclase (GGDEF)-like protein